MTSLPNFPILNQLADTNEINREFDCVPTSIAACLEYLLGKPFDGAAIKDAVYGNEYQGGTAAVKYVDYCKAQGVRLFPLSGTGAQMVAAIRAQIEARHPSIGTEPDPYANPALGWSHVVAFFKCDEPRGTLSCADPFGGHIVTLSDGEWAQRLLYNQVWVLEVELMQIDLNMLEVAAHFDDVGVTGNQWHCKATGKVIQFAILNFYRAFGGVALCGLSFLGLPLSNEVPIAGLPGAVRQNFERGVLVYDPTHKNDNPPGVGAVYLAHLYSGVGQDPRIAELQALAASLQQQLNSAPDVAALQAQLTAALQKLAQIKALAV